MNRGIVVGITIVVVAAAGYGAYTFLSRPSQTPTSDKQANLTTPNTPVGGRSACAPTPAPDETPVGMWKVDYDKSSLGYTILWDGEPSKAIFQKWNAKIDFDPAKLSKARAVVTIDVASAVSDFPDYDADRAGNMGFDAKLAPTAVFIARSFRSNGPDRYVAVGDLTIKCMTKEIALPFTFRLDGNTAHVVGEVTLNRRDFGVGTGSASGINLDSDNPVSHMVTVPIDITATR